MDKETNGKTVLVVDDEGPVRRLVCRVCRRMGASNVLDARNVKDALDLLEKNRVDLVISDLNMPDESGLKIGQTMKAAGKKTALLIFSGSLDAAELARTTLDGADMAVLKSEDLSELERAISRLLRTASM